MEKEYLDARFDGIEKLMDAQNKNLNGYIAAVSSNIRDVRKDLKDHVESDEAHGVKSSRNTISTAASWLGLAVATILGAVELLRGHSR